MSRTGTPLSSFGLLLAVAFGSGCGAVARYLVSVQADHLAPDIWPWPTLVVNVLGSCLIGYCAALVSSNTRWALHPLVTHMVMVGFCGGFTTFSLFSLEIWLLGQHSIAAAFGYGVISWASWLAAVWLGFHWGRRQVMPALC